MFDKCERILIVDDCEIQRRVLSKNLRAHGYTVQTASDGVEALKMIAEAKFDLVITDWNMPNLDGNLLCQCLRSQYDADRYIYIIMMTDETETSDVVASFAAGVDDFITKPLHLPELLARIQAGRRVLSHHRRLTYVAERDPLTNLLNRRSMSPRMTGMIEQSRNTTRPLSCILLDLDHFKGINDQFGHSVGDEALIAVSACLVNSFRTSDDVFRYGGEEFLAVLPETNSESAALCAERCRIAISELDMSVFGVEEPLTASFGVAQLCETEHSMVELLERADVALLSAKQDGRNRIATSRPAKGRIENAVVGLMPGILDVQQASAPIPSAK